MVTMKQIKTIPNVTGALNDTLTEGFSDLSSFLANTPNPTVFADEGNGFVDNMIQME